MNIVIRGNVVGLKPGNLVIAQKFRLFCTFVLHLLMCSRLNDVLRGMEQRISCRRYMEWEHILHSYTYIP